MKYIFLIILLFPFAAQAEKQSEAVCDALTKYKKINNQSAAYRPGVDVHGNAVTPADVNAPSPIFENVTKVPLTVDLANRLSSLQGKGIEMQANFGLLSIHPDGRVTFGEEDFTSDIKKVCGIPHEEKKQVMAETQPVAEVKPVQARPPQPKPIVEEKIITHKPELVPETLQGGAYRE